MKLRIIGPEQSGISGYDVWLESLEEWSTAAVLLGSGKTKIEALAAAQWELARLARQMGELVWQSHQPAL